MTNVAILGFGYWGPNLLRNFQETPGAHVMACCDVKPDRLESARAKYPNICLTTDYDAILADSRLHAVAIATPVASHYAFARKALEHGKHVLLEKPLTASVAEAESLMEIADKQSLTLMVDHTFIYTGAVRKMKEILDQDQLGDLYYFDSVRINLGLVQRDVNVLWDLAPHDIAILDFLVKETPSSVCATGACNIANGVEAVAYLTVYYDSGLIAHFHNNWLAPVKIRTILVGGSKKMILYDDMEPSEKVKVYDRGVDISTPEGLHHSLVAYRLGDMWAPKLDTTEALRLVTAEFIDAVGGGRRPLTDGTSGLNVVRILEAAQMSIKRRGREVRL